MKPFINKYNLEGLDIPPIEKDDWKKIEKKKSNYCS